jgi:hypothetical protein
MSVAACRLDPQLMQVAAFGELRHAHPAQICTSIEPQFAQKFASGSLLHWHVSHSMQADLSSQLGGSGSADVQRADPDVDLSVWRL